MEFKNFSLKSLQGIDEILMAFLIEYTYQIYESKKVSVSQFYVTLHIEDTHHTGNINRTNNKL